MFWTWCSCVSLYDSCQFFFFVLFFFQTEKKRGGLNVCELKALRQTGLCSELCGCEKFTLHAAEQKPLSFISLTFQVNQISSEHLMRTTQQQKRSQRNEANNALGQTCLINQSMLRFTGCVLNMYCVFTEFEQKIL